MAARVRSAQLRIARDANAETIRLYRSVGQDIFQRNEQPGQAAEVVERLAAGLRREFPGRQGFSFSSLGDMDAMAAAWPAGGTVPAPVVEALPWGHTAPSSTAWTTPVTVTGTRAWP